MKEFLCRSVILLLIHFFSIATANKTVGLLPETTCHIPDFDPFDEEVMGHLHGSLPIPQCPENRDIFNLFRDPKTQEYIVTVREKVGLRDDYFCCVQEVQRIDDNKQKLGECLHFQRSILVPKSFESILITCTHLETAEKLNQFYHLVQEKKEAVKTFASFRNVPQRAPSVLIVGVDSVGRLNVPRALPKSHNFLRQNDFYDMKANNKVGLNTYPNLMALLTGLNDETHGKTFNPEKEYMDSVQFIWKDFKNSGYATAYTEDFGYVSTFNYLMKGFKNPPVDHYGRPGASFLEESKGLKFPDCSMRRFKADRVYQHAVEFAKFYHQKPYFGMFWTNELSHNELSVSKWLDDPLLYYLTTLKDQGTLDDAIVILMADHGLRLGQAPQLKPHGCYEDHLPMLYISLPKWFKEQHPEAAENLRINQERLVGHFDLYVTFKDLIHRSGRNPTPANLTAEHCATGQSLFEEIPRDRTCLDSCVRDPYCTCNVEECQF